MIFLVKFIIPFQKGIGSFLLICLQSMYAVKDDRFCFKDNNALEAKLFNKMIIRTKNHKQRMCGLVSIMSLEFSLCL